MTVERPLKHQMRLPCLAEAGPEESIALACAPCKRGSAGRGRPPGRKDTRSLTEASAARLAGRRPPGLGAVEEILLAKAADAPCRRALVQRHETAVSGFALDHAPGIVLRLGAPGGSDEHQRR